MAKGNYDPLEYHRNYYGVPAHKGVSITWKGKPGKITGASGPHIKIKLTGESGGYSVHPTDENLVYLVAK